MHYCCVQLCGKNTKTSGVQKDGISFHRFPKCPNMKEIWINATQRSDDWFPSPSSVVCSRHFKSEYLKLTKGNRRILYLNAVPTLHLPTVIPGDGSIAQNTFSEVAKVTQILPTAENHGENEDVDTLVVKEEEFSEEEDELDGNEQEDCSIAEKRRKLDNIATADTRESVDPLEVQDLQTTGSEMVTFLKLLEEKLQKLPDVRRMQLQDEIMDMVLRETNDLN